MNNNPYAGIIHTLREEKTSESYVGTVISVTPLRVSYAGIDFDSGEIYKLVPEQVQEQSENAEPAEPTEGETDAACLQVGDRVCVLPSGDDIIVLGKIERAN